MCISVVVHQINVFKRICVVPGTQHNWRRARDQWKLGCTHLVVQSSEGSVCGMSKIIE